MFNSIVKSVLCEINAKDAYDKFYNSIPENEFMEIVNFYGKFDNLMKLVMNSVKSGESNLEDAKNFVNIYKSATNEVRAEFVRRFKSGQYENLEDADLDLEMLVSCGVASEKSLTNDGLLIIYEDENCKITCTTTYAANRHYYGHTQWCTASDRKGNYDGWLMFLRYTFKQTMGVYYRDRNINFENLKACLIQCIEKTTNKTYQLQIDKDHEIGMVCDEEDSSVRADDIQSIFVIRNLMVENLSNWIALTKKNLEIEYKYMVNKEDFVRRKEDILIRRRQKKIDELTEKVKEFNEKKAKFVYNKFLEFSKTNLIHNENLINEIYKICDELYELQDDNVTDNEILTNTDKKLQSIGYLLPEHNWGGTNGEFWFQLFETSMAIGKYVYSDGDYSQSPTIINDVSLYNNHFNVEIDGFLICVYNGIGKEKKLLLSIVGDVYENTEHLNDSFYVIRYKDFEKNEIALLANLNNGLTYKLPNDFDYNDYDSFHFCIDNILAYGRDPHYEECNNIYTHFFEANSLTPIGDFITIEMTYVGDTFFINNENCYILLRREQKLIPFKNNLNYDPNNVVCYITQSEKYFIIINNNNGDVYELSNLEKPLYDNVKVLEYVDSNRNDNSIDLRFETKDGKKGRMHLKD